MSQPSLPRTPKIPVESFKLETPQSELDDFKTLLRLSRIPKATYENTAPASEKFGVSREWMTQTKDALMELDWRRWETKINAIPQYKAKVEVDGTTLDMHFMGLFSTRADAIPIVFLHGWPGCFLEFLPMLEMISEKYTQDELPYHFIVPSLPGWAYSSPPPLDRDFAVADIAKVINGLMTGLGFDKYVAQGGDIGSMVAVDLGVNHAACTAVHINFRVMTGPPAGTPEAEALKGKQLSRDQFLTGFQQFGYALEQATKPSTIGAVVGCNPLSLLCWIGEKYTEAWRGKLSLDYILAITTLYWLTDTYPSSIYPYRFLMGSRRGTPTALDEWCPKPLGYSLFKYEIAQTPPHWVAKTGNLIWSKKHDEGGHFAALELPETLWADVKDFVGKAWTAESQSRL